MTSADVLLLVSLSGILWMYLLIRRIKKMYLHCECGYMLRKQLNGVMILGVCDKCGNVYRAERKPR